MYDVSVSLLVRGGRIVTPAGVLLGDVLCRDGTFQAIGPQLSAPSGAEVLDAAGCFVLPGGVDPHCHLMSGLTEATRASLLGGTTTALSFSLPEDGESTVTAFRRAAAKVDAGEAFVDIGLHAMCFAPNQLGAADMTELVSNGADAIKIFLAFPELGIMATGDGLHRVMTYARALDLPVQVHCEDGELIEALVDEVRLSGSAASAAGCGFAATTFADVRPPVLEAVAVERALAVAGMTGARLYVTHVSSAAALANIRRARLAGRGDVTAEACLHHVLLDETEYRGSSAGDLLVAPPLRSLDDVRALRTALADGTVDTLGSDHAQSRTTVDSRIWPSGDAAYGIAGIGARVPLLLSWGLREGVPVERLAHVLATGPADAFGYLSKGRIVAGNDADLVVWDPKPTWLVNGGSFQDGTGMSPYLGRRVEGKIRAVVLRGHVAVREGRLTDAGRRGRRLFRADSVPGGKARKVP